MGWDGMEWEKNNEGFWSMGEGLESRLCLGLLGFGDLGAFFFSVFIWVSVDGVLYTAIRDSMFMFLTVGCEG